MYKTDDLLKGSYRYEKNGWIFLHIIGEPYQRGFQHGFHMARELSDVMKTLDFYLYRQTGKSFSFFMEAAKRFFLPHIEEEYTEELQGIRDGAAQAGVKFPLEALIVWNGYLEFTEDWWPAQKEQEALAGMQKAHCSAFIATGDATADRGIVIGHNTWLDFVVGQYLNVILDLVPADGFRIFMQAGPGFIHSFTDFFLTGAGIMGTETTIQGFRNFDENGIPEFDRVRKAMQYGKNIDQWVQLMREQNNGGVADSWLLGDIKTNEIARFELGLEYSDLQKRRNGCFTGFNAPTDPQIRNLECSDTGYDDLRTNGARRVRWDALISQNYGHIDAKTGMKMLADHDDVYLGQAEHPGNRTLCGHGDADPVRFGGEGSGQPFFPSGALDAKVSTSKLARNLSFWARFGRSCDEPFLAERFLMDHPQWTWQRGFLKDRPTQPWTLFETDFQPD